MRDRKLLSIQSILIHMCRRFAVLKVRMCCQVGHGLREIGLELRAWAGCASQALRLQQVVRQLSLLCGLVGGCVMADLPAQGIWQSTGHTAIASVLLAYRETVHALQTSLLVCRTGRLLDGGSLQEICTWEVAGWHQPVPSEACCDEKLTPPLCRAPGCGQQKTARASFGKRGRCGLWIT